MNTPVSPTLRALLQQWCDRLLTLQLDRPEPELDGGVLCPSCQLMHGRIADAAYPLLTLADCTGESKYIRAAERCVDWAARNLRLHNGAFRNERVNGWTGITVFTAIALSEALLHHGHLLAESTADRWKSYIADGIEYLDANLNVTFLPVVNYPVSLCAAKALAGRLLHRPDWVESARQAAHAICDTLTPEGLLPGEAHPIDGVSPKGCRPIDIGYNIEESVPALMICAAETGDPVLQARTDEAMRAHLHFLLPDGGLDNSFGCRSAKWTYYGSRTSDGAPVGLARRLDDPLFAEAAQRCVDALMRCTADGLLTGGPMQAAAGEPTCVHHTFCHAKSVAALLDAGFSAPSARRSFPWETDGITPYPSMHVTQVRCGAWYASVSDFDFPSDPGLYCSGGTLTLLHHRAVGAVLAAAMPIYRPVEPTNMQFPRRADAECPAVELTRSIDGHVFRSCLDRAAVVTTVADAVTVRGHLTDRTACTDAPYRFTYTFSPDAVHLTAWCAADCTLRVPLISAPSEQIQCTPHRIASAASGWVRLLTSDAVLVPSLPDPADRVFHPVGGWTRFPVSVSLRGGESVSCTVRIAAE